MNKKQEVFIAPLLAVLDEEQRERFIADFEEQNQSDEFLCFGDTNPADILLGAIAWKDTKHAQEWIDIYVKLDDEKFTEKNT